MRNSTYPLKLTASCLLLCLNLDVHAAGYQLVGELNYENPAALGFVKTMELDVGTLLSRSHFGFEGSTGPFTGSTSSNQTDNFFHGKLAYRVLPKLVLGINITQPAITDIFYPIDSFVQYNSTGTYFKDIDISPRFAYQVTDKFNVGAGFNVNFNYAAELNFIVPPNGQLLNTGHVWAYAYGYNLGFTYQLCQTIFGLAYHSKIGNFKGSAGVSTWGPITNSNLRNNVNIPAVWTANIVHFISQEWLVSGALYYSIWNSTPNYLTLNNTAIGQINVPFFFKNTLSVQLGTKYNFCGNWAALLGVMYEPAIQPPEYESIGLPLYARWSIGAGPEYTFQKNWTAKAMYAYSWGSLHYDNIGAVGPVNGDSTMHFNSVGISLAYKA